VAHERGVTRDREIVPRFREAIAERSARLTRNFILDVFIN
jgi:hypothetical protein